MRRRGATRGDRVTAAVGALGLGAALATVHAAINARLLRTPAVGAGGADGRRPSASVLVPARDEADRIGPTLAAVLRQTGWADRPGDLEVLVLDDGSTDGTAEVVREVATRIGCDPTAARVLEGRPLPPGWLGKPHACWQLAETARGEVLVFLDADVHLEPDAVAAAVDLLDASGLDLVCPYPRQVAATAAERLVQPLLQWSWLTFLPLRLAERSTRPSLAAGNGQLLVCRTAAYRAAGGHAAVRDEVLEDVALARAFKRAGLVAGMADGTDLATCRMYTGWAELEAGYTKSLWAAFGGAAGAVGVLGLLVGLYVVPPLAGLLGLLLGRRRLAAAGTAGYLAGVAGRAVTAARTGGRVGDAPAHPASVLLLAELTRRSLRRRARGDLAWKGRPVGGAGPAGAGP